MHLFQFSLKELRKVENFAATQHHYIQYVLLNLRNEFLEIRSKENLYEVDDQQIHNPLKYDASRGVLKTLHQLNLKLHAQLN